MSDSDKAPPAAIGKDEPRDSKSSLNTWINTILNQRGWYFACMGDLSFVRGARCWTLNVTAGMGSSFVPVVQRHLSFNSQRHSWNILSRYGSHLNPQLRSIIPAEMIFLNKILKPKWNVCRRVMARENWFPLNLHKAIHCGKWKICLQRQASTSANAESKRGGGGDRTGTGTYITLHDCRMTTRGILQEKIILTGFDEKGNS